MSIKKIWIFSQIEPTIFLFSNWNQNLLQLLSAIDTNFVENPQKFVQNFQSLFSFKKSAYLFFAQITL